MKEQLLFEQIRYIGANSPYYRAIFKEKGILISELNSITDFKKLPLTTKEDFAKNTDAFYIVSKKEIVEYCTTSGTTGQPLSVGLTKKDLARLATNEKFTFLSAGISEDDIVQLMLTLDKQFMAGLAYVSGLHAIGCAVVRSGPGSPAFQLAAIERHQSTVLVAVPSFLLRMIDFAKQEKLDLNSLSVKKVICIGESIRNEDLSPNDLALKIQKDWNVALYSTFASTEMQTAFSECTQQKGSHLNADLLYAEVLDTDGNETKDGEVGELVITHIGVEAMPLIRYQTGDLVARFSSPCACGNDSFRIGPIVGRKNQLLKINGTSVYPATIFTFLKKYEVSDAILLVKENELSQQEVELLVATNQHELSLIAPVLFDLLKVKIAIRIADKEAIAQYRNPENRKPAQIVYLKNLSVS